MLTHIYPLPPNKGLELSSRYIDFLKKKVTDSAMWGVP